MAHDATDGAQDKISIRRFTFPGHDDIRSSANAGRVATAITRIGAIGKPRTFAVGLDVGGGHEAILVVEADSLLSYEAMQKSAAACIGVWLFLPTRLTTADTWREYIAERFGAGVIELPKRSTPAARVPQC